MDLTEPLFHEKIGVWRFLRVSFRRLEKMEGIGKQEKAVAQMTRQDCFREIKSIERLHMESTKEKNSLSFYVTAAVYVLFNLRIAADPLTSLVATVKQIALTAPYVIGVTCVAIAIVQYMAEGEKVPWPQRFRLFFTIGIFAGLVYGIYDYTGAGMVQ